MPKIISEETVAKAKELRKQGLTFDQISQELDVSKWWCKQNLKGIETDKAAKIKHLTERSKSKAGVSRGEIFKELELMELSEQEAHKKLSSSIKTIRSKGKDCIVRPNWMMPEFSQYITHKVMDASVMLEERCYEEALELRATLMESCVTDEQKKQVPSVLMLKQAMLSICMVGASTRPATMTRLNNWLESLNNSALALAKRNDYDVVQRSKNIEGFDFDGDLPY